LILFDNFNNSNSFGLSGHGDLHLSLSASLVTPKHTQSIFNNFPAVSQP